MTSSGWNLSQRTPAVEIHVGRSPIDPKILWRCGFSRGLSSRCGLQSRHKSYSIPPVFRFLSPA